MRAAHHHLRQDLFNAREKRKIGAIGHQRLYPGEVVNVTRTVFQAVYIGHLSRSQYGLRSNHQFRQARNVVKINRQGQQRHQPLQVATESRLAEVEVIGRRQYQRRCAGLGCVLGQLQRLCKRRICDPYQ